MKNFIIIVPQSKKDVLAESLQEMNIPYHLILGEGNATFNFIIQTEYSNTLLHELKLRGVGTVFGEIVVAPIVTHLSPKNPSPSIKKSGGANVEEIRSVLLESGDLNINYIILVLLSAILASYGLYANNVVIIIGSMIVAPLMAPIALTSLGAILPGSRLLQKGLIAEILGISLTVIVGYIVGIVVNVHSTPIDTLPELKSRGVIDGVALIFALVSGLAAGIIIAKGSNLSIVGVAIAASLAPPAAAIGLFLAGTMWKYASEASLLLLLNIVAINLACSLVFLFLGLASTTGESRRSTEIASRTNKILIYVASVILLAIILVIANNNRVFGPI